jgi:MFS family permease
MKSITTNPAATLSTNIVGSTPWVVCFSAALFFFFIFIQVNIFNAIAPSLMKEFSLSAGKVGQISAYYFYATMIFVYPAGLILDRFSTRKVILWAMGVSIACTYLFSMTNSVLMGELCRFGTGVGGAFCLISCIRLASRWFPPRRLALVIGLIITIAMFGGMLAQTPMTLLTDSLGWRNTLVLDAASGVVMLILIALFVQDQPNQATIASHPPMSYQSFKNSLVKSLTNSQNWLGGFYTSLLNLPLILMGAVWGNLYLVQTHHFTRTQSSFVISMIFIGTIIGSPAIGWFSDRIGLRRLPMLLGAFCSLIVILLIILIPSLSMTSMMLLFLALGFFTSSQIISYPLIAESNSKTLTGTAEGIASTLIMAGGTAQPIFGMLMGLHWNHTLINNLPFYSANDYFTAMMMIPCAFVLGLIAAFFIRETHCKPLD